MKGHTPYFLRNAVPLKNAMICCATLEIEKMVFKHA